MLALVSAVATAALVALLKLRAEMREAATLATVSSRAGVLMAETLGTLETVPNVVSVMVPDVADWAIVHLLEEHGGVTRAALTHRDPAVQAEIEQLHEHVAFNTSMSTGPALVMRTGQSTFLPR